MALEQLYSVAQLAKYFGVTESTVQRWIKEWNDTKGKKGLRAGKVNGQWRSKESWVKTFARDLYGDEKKGA